MSQTGVIDDESWAEVAAGGAVKLPAWSSAEVNILGSAKLTTCPSAKLTTVVGEGESIGWEARGRTHAASHRCVVRLYDAAGGACGAPGGSWWSWATAASSSPGWCSLRLPAGGADSGSELTCTLSAARVEESAP